MRYKSIGGIVIRLLIVFVTLVVFDWVWSDLGRGWTSHWPVSGNFPFRVLLTSALAMIVGIVFTWLDYKVESTLNSAADPFVFFVSGMGLVTGIVCGATYQFWIKYLGFAGRGDLSPFVLWQPLSLITLSILLVATLLVSLGLYLTRHKSSNAGERLIKISFAAEICFTVLLVAYFVYVFSWS